MEEFMHFLQTETAKPGFISWFHLFALIPIIVLAIIIPCFYKDTSEKNYKKILFVSWIILIVSEIFKQLVKAFHYDNPSYWEYSYRDFPFSLCSMILYLLPIVLFVNKEKHPKIVDATTGYLCLTSLMAGIAVCIYPDVAVSRYISISVQTFIHHGLQVIIGVFVYVWNRRNITIKTFYRSLIAFGIAVVIAIIINLAFYPRYINMFFINPMVITNLPIGNVVQEKAGYPVYLIGYLSLIVLMTFLTYLVETGIYKLVRKKKD